MKNKRRGYELAIASILLATFAQLAMKWGMSHLSFDGKDWLTVIYWWNQKLAASLVFAGILCYGLSTVCWLGALGHLPLNKAYPLLSASYALVYIATVSLPWFNETFALVPCIGVVLISLGVLLVVSAPSSKSST